MNANEELIAEAHSHIDRAADAAPASARQAILTGKVEDQRLSLVARFADALAELKAERDQLAAKLSEISRVWMAADSISEIGFKVATILDSAPHVALDRVKAEALREAADDFETYWTSGAPVKHPPEVWLRRIADRIERGESNE